MPTHTITLHGYVQYVGLRELVMDVGKTQDRRGFVFNEADGTVRVVMAGTRHQATEFVASIEERSADLRADIESVEVTEFDGEIDLPPFGILPTDDLADIGRKLDIGIRSLTGIEEHAGQISVAVEANNDRLSSIEEDTNRLSRIEEHAGQISAAVEANNDRLSSIEEDTDRLSRIEENTGQISAAVEANTDRLSSIEEDTDRLSRIEENTDLLPHIEEHTEKLVDGQERMIDILDERL